MYINFTNFTSTRVYPNTLSSDERTFLSSLEIDEDALNKIEAETREQASSERWREERLLGSQPRGFI